MRCKVKYVWMLRTGWPFLFTLADFIIDLNSTNSNTAVDFASEKGIECAKVNYENRRTFARSGTTIPHKDT